MTDLHEAAGSGDVAAVRRLLGTAPRGTGRRSTRLHLDRDAGVAHPRDLYVM